MITGYNILNESTERKIDVLRKLDSIIDFSRSSYQLDIIVVLGKIDKPLDPGKLSAILNIPRKQILDALRKLRLKGLIDVTHNGAYTLTGNGRDFYRTLIEIINENNSSDESNGNTSTERIHETAKLLAKLSINSRISMLLNTILLLNKPITIEKASEILDVPKDEVLLHLTPYIKGVGESGIFKIVRCRGGILRRRHDKCIYVAEPRSTRISRYLDPHYRFRKFLMKLTYTVNPEIADILLVTYSFAILSIALLIYRFTMRNEAVVIGGLTSVALLALYLIFHFTKYLSTRKAG